jgi:hypothetical protein
VRSSEPVQQLKQQQNEQTFNLAAWAMSRFGGMQALLKIRYLSSKIHQNAPKTCPK